LRRASISGATSSASDWSFLRASPSWTDNSTTRPPVRGATWTSSTSMVPETGCTRGRQLAKEPRKRKASAARKRRFGDCKARQDYQLPAETKGTERRVDEAI